MRLLEAVVVVVVVVVVLADIELAFHQQLFNDIEQRSWKMIQI